MLDVKILDTLMSTSARLDKDETGKEVKQTMYRGVMGSLLYLNASSPDISSMWECAHDFKHRQMSRI